MTDHHDTPASSTPRERELEGTVARLQAEIDTLRGEDPGATTSRFLEMAAATVDQAVADARREADEIIEEVSGQAEARRDEATRVAAEAEALAEELLEKADRAQESVAEATETAAAIKSDAKEEAATFIAAEREKVAAEVEAFAQVRAALDDERVALESYHEKLRRGVQDLAESMVSFMNTEIAGGGAGVIEGIVSPQLEAALADLDDGIDAPAEARDDLHADLDSDLLADLDDDLAADLDDDLDDDLEMSEDVALAADDLDDDLSDDEADVHEDVVLAADLDDGLDDDLNDDLNDDELVAIATVDPLDTPAPFAEAPDAVVADDPWITSLEAAIPEADRIVDMPDTAIDEIPVGPPSFFGGASVIDEEPETSGGLFSRTTSTDDDVESDGLAATDTDADADADDADDADKPEGRKIGLFGMLGARLLESSPPEELADALDTDDTDDQAFRQFLDGDDAPDPSRDWLLRSDQS